MRTEFLLTHFGASNRANSSVDGNFFDDLLGQDQGRGRRPNAKSNQNRRANRDNPFEQEARDKFPSYENEKKGNLPPRNTSNQEAIEELRRLSAENIKGSLQNNINANAPPAATGAPGPGNIPTRKNRGDAFDGSGFEARPGQRNRGLAKKKLRNDPFAVLDEKEKERENNEQNDEPEGPFSETPSKNTPFPQNSAPEGVPKRKGDRIVGTVVDDVENPFAPPPQPGEEQGPPQRQRFAEEGNEVVNNEDDEEKDDVTHF